MTKKRRLITLIILIILAAAAAFFIYVSIYYHADDSAAAALESDAQAAVYETDYGWFFDGPSESTALIFYPGAKVDTAAYAPFLHKLSASGMDVCLVRMPFHLAVFGRNAAGDIINNYDYENWYIGGHSLGGAMAASYASENPEGLDGVILCAAYPVSKLDDDMKEVLIYGSEDLVVNRGKIIEGKQYAPAELTEEVIQGGNHAQFGNYGEQKGDGKASVSADVQQAEAIKIIMESIE